MKGSEAKALHQLQQSSPADIISEAYRLSNVESPSRGARTRMRRLLQVARKGQYPIALMSDAEQQEIRDDHSQDTNYKTEVHERRMASMRRELQEAADRGELLQYLNTLSGGIFAAEDETA